MNTEALKLATRYIGPLLILLSLVVLYRGHNLPGGGFIGGLIAASAFMLLALAHGWGVVEKRLPIDTLTLMTIGLGIAVISALPGMFIADAVFAGLWLPTWQIPLLGKLKLGTPLLFDVGVYLTVMGFTLKCALAMGKENE